MTTPHQVTNPTTPPGAPISLPELPGWVLNAARPHIATEMQDYARAAIIADRSRSAASPDSEAAFKNFHRSLCVRFGYVHDEKDWRRDQVSLEEHIARLVQPASPDVAKMEALMQALMQEVGQYGLDCALKGELAPRRSLAEAANALGAAATQARAAVGAETRKSQAHALAEEVKTAWGRQDPKRLWTAVEALEVLAAQTPGEGRMPNPLAAWPIAGIRVDRGTVVIVARGNVMTADEAARWMCGELLALKNGPKPPATPGEA